MLEPLLQIKDLLIQNKQSNDVVINQLSLDLYAGKMLGIIGESGSGKSITAQAIMGFLPQGFTVKGNVLFNGNPISFSQKNNLIGRDICFIPQDYMSGFSPFYRIGSQMDEQLATHTSLSKKERKQWILTMLDRVQLPAKKVYHSYHFELSGGQLQRAVIASALILNPKLLICDEITTALDPKNAEQVMLLLKEYQVEFSTTILFISHHLHHVMKYCDQVAVMYGGEWMERGKTEEVHKNPSHPYTQLLLQAVPRISQQNETLVLIPGEPGEIERGGCPFAIRCPHSQSNCHQVPVHLLGTQNHEIACHQKRILEGNELNDDTTRSPIFI